MDIVTPECACYTTRKMMRLADTNRDEVISIEEMMNFIVYITKHK